LYPFLGGFAVGVPGFLPERLSKDVLKGHYVLISGCELLLKLGASETPKEQELVYQDDPFLARFHKVKLHARLRQHAELVRGLARVIVLDRGLARRVGTPRRWKCERHSRVFCDSAMLTGACAPISKGTPGEYWLLWGIHDPAPPPVDEGEVEGYDTTPLAQIYKILEMVQAQEALADPQSEEGWFKGGVMHRISSSMGRDAGVKVMMEAHAARASTGNPLHFVWDVVGTEAGFGCLKFILDAARAPLCDRPDFEETHGLPRYLKFAAQKRRVPIATDMFEGVY